MLEVWEDLLKARPPTSHFPGTALLAGLGHGACFFGPDDVCWSTSCTTASPGHRYDSPLGREEREAQRVWGTCSVALCQAEPGSQFRFLCASPRRKAENVRLDLLQGISPCDGFLSGARMGLIRGSGSPSVQSRVS